MSLIIEKLPAVAGSKETTALVKTEGGVVVGFMRRFKATRTEQTPWQGFLMDGVHPQTGGPCVGTLVASEFGRNAQTVVKAAIAKAAGLI